MKIRLLVALAFMSGFLTLPSAFAASCGGGGGPGAAKPLATPMVLSVKPGTPAPIVAQVVWAKGIVKVIGADKKERVLKPNAPINLNDTIVTDGKSQAEIVFTDHTIMTFQENTKLFVNKYEYHPEVKKGSAGTYIMNLIEGGFRTITGAISKSNPPDYHVDTDIAIMGVRGTDYSANFGACKLYMKYHSGTPFVKNDKGVVVLTGSQPFAYVPNVSTSPTFVKQEPAVFKTPITMTPASFNVSNIPKADLKFQSPIQIKELKALENTSGGGGGSGGKCVPTAGGVNINFK